MLESKEYAKREEVKEYIILFNTLFHQKISQEQPFNVLIIGKTGVGKSTLVNAIFSEDFSTTGVGSPVTKYITKYEKPGYPISIYDTPGWELLDEANQQNKKDVDNLLSCKEHEHDNIHIVWYCVQNTIARFEDNEHRWLEEISRKNIPVILVLTQTLNSEKNEFFDYLKSADIPAQDIIPVLAKPFPITSEYVVNSHGLGNLIKESAKFLDKSVRRSFVSVQTVDIEMKAIEARKYIEEMMNERAISNENIVKLSDDFSISTLGIPEVLSSVAAFFVRSLDFKSLQKLLKLTIETIGSNLRIVLQIRNLMPNRTLQIRMLRALAEVYINYFIEESYNSRGKSDNNNQ